MIISFPRMDLGGPFLPSAAGAYLCGVVVLAPCHEDVSSVGERQLRGGWPGLPWRGLEHLVEL